MPDGAELGKRYAEAMFEPRILTPQDERMVADLLDRPVTDEAVELVLRAHLPVATMMSNAVLCMCDVRPTYEGPVGHRLHVAAELRKAGMLREPVDSDGGETK